MKPIHPILLALAAILACAPLWAASRAVLLTCGEAPGYTQALADALEGDGISLTRADLSADLPALLDPAKNPLLIAVAPGSISAEGLRLISNYLENGGRLLTIGGPAFTDILYGYDGGWLSREEYLRRAAADVAEGQRETILDASDPSAVKEFKRGSNNPDDNVTYTVGDYGLEGSRGQIKGDVPNLNSWDNFNYKVSPKMTDANAIAFMAKGGADTKYLYVEMTDKGGSRWYASAALTEDWQQYLLSESDFAWWHDSRPSDRQHPEIGEIAMLTMGFAQTGAPIPPGHHVFYVSDVELLKADIQEKEGAGLTVATLCPEDQVFPVTNAAGIETCQNQIFVKDREYALPDKVFSCSPKRQGTGIDKGRDFRFVPLLELYDAKELHCGYAAWMNVFAMNGKGKVSLVGCLSPQSEDFYDQNGIAAAVDIARAMLSPALLYEGGTDEYIYPLADTRSIRYGGNLVTLGGNAEDYRVTTTLYCEGDPIAEYSASPKGGQFKYSAEYRLGDDLPDCAVSCLYDKDGNLLDRISQIRLVFWEPKDPDQRKYITSTDGYFMQDGEIKSFFGVNYMPSSGIAELNGHNFEHYVSRAAYDPEVILMDLQRIRDIGMNAVSVFIHAGQMDSNNMLDLIDLCDGMDIYVDLSLRSTGDLFLADRKLVKQVMDRLHLSEIDNIIAYDTAWEPRIGAYEDTHYVGRKGWDGEWERWIAEQYGSVEAAEKVWGTPVTRDENGRVRGVTDEMLDDYSDKYLKLVNAYRRFIDDQVARLFTDTYNYWREQDPNHLVSFRMSMSGSADPVSGMAPRDFCYDFQSLAPAVDVMEPEGYALRYESDRSMCQVLFANAYARYVKPQAPVVWKEFGRHMWSGSNFDVPEGFARDQEEYYRRCLDYMFRGYTSGMFCWYFPGGFRIGENSDYGILNPDGSDRPCTALLREYAPRFINQDMMTALEHVYTVDRDDSPRGIHGIFEALIPEMLEADRNRESFGFRNKSQVEPSRIRYADDLTEDTLCGGPAGKDPFKFINGMIKSAAPYRVGAKRMLRVEVINTGLADWRAGSVRVQLGGTSVPVKEDVFCQRSAAVELPYTAGRIRLTINGIPFGPGYPVK